MISTALALVSTIVSVLQPSLADPQLSRTTTLSSLAVSVKRMTINTPQSYNVTSTLLGNAILQPSYNSCSIFGDAQAQEAAAVTPPGNLTLFKEAVGTRVGPWDMMSFGVLRFTPVLNLYLPPIVPQVTSYTLGNPMVAETMIQYDWAAALHTPLRVLLVENLSTGGCRVVWDLPSSLIAVPGALGDARKEALLKQAALELDQKVEVMLRNVTGMKETSTTAY
ncbi:hypothetical protein DL93DRAFT_2078921 [Clavulina sp. PMI_390]|nr:hypothetical protein DL93DRAFT_2078921 [Clavulina sp. PMI_390]